MKKTLSLIIVGFLCLSTLSVLAPQIKANSGTIIFEDDFETYAVGSFPSAGGWELVWNGKGTAYQVMTDTVSYSPTKSLRLWGQSGWSANVQRKFTSSAEIIGFEAYIRTESNTGSGWKVAGICFWKLDSPVPWGKRFADVGFGPDGQLYTRPVKGSSSYFPLGLSYEADRWYKVGVIIDRTVETYDVWIDDVLAAEDVTIWDTYEIDALMMESGHSSIKVYFDDIRVFEVPTELPATIDIDPDTLNLKNKGEWITAYIELPEGYNVNDINVATILLNETIPVDMEAPVTVGDYDSDSVPDLMVKFDRASIIEWFGAVDYAEDTGRSCLVALRLTGEVSGTTFEGSDTFNVLRK